MNRFALSKDVFVMLGVLMIVCYLTELCLSQDLVQLILHRELVEYSVCTSCLM